MDAFMKSELSCCGLLVAGTRLQQYSFALCMYAATTFVLRAIDPKSYGHIFPIAITNFLSYTCTDALLTI